MAASADALRLGRRDRRLLPAAILAALGEPRPRFGRTLRDWLVDVAVLLASAGIGALVLLEIWTQQTPLLHLMEHVLGPISVAALWWRRRAPVAVAVIAIVASTVSGIAAGASLAALFTVGVHRPPRTVAWVLVLSLLALVPYHFVYRSHGGAVDLEDVAIGTLLTLVVTGWGLFVRSRRQLLLTLHERALHAEAEQRERTEQARRAERTSIAREMHDVLAHRLSLVSLHAGALEHRADARPEEVAHAAGVIRAGAHDALEELRAVIGVLREEEDGAVPEPPQPGLADLPALVEEARRAGTRVELDVRTTAAPPAAVGRTAYRIVQEGLTNARKHAPGARVDVGVEGEPGGTLGIAVSNPLAIGVGATAVPGARQGLVGLAERATLAGGRLEHAVDDGRFVLRAELPWEAGA